MIAIPAQYNFDFSSGLNAGIHGRIVSRYTDRSFTTKESKAFKIRYKKGFKGDILLSLRDEL